MRTVAEIMATRLATVSPETSIYEAIKILLDGRFSGAPVVAADGTLVGVLSKKDCLKVIFSASYHQDWAGTVAEYMSTNVETLDVNTDLVSAAKFFLDSPYRRFPVLRDGKLVGQVSRADLLRALIEEA